MLIHKRFGVYCFFATGGQSSPVPKEVFPGAEPLASRCRAPCSPVPEKHPVQKVFGMGSSNQRQYLLRLHLAAMEMHFRLCFLLWEGKIGACSLSAKFPHTII